MTHLTPSTSDALHAALAAAPALTAPTRAKLHSLESLIGRHLCSSRRALAPSEAEYKSLSRLFDNRRCSVGQLRALQCARLYARCAERCRGRDVIAICDTCEFSLAGLAGRARGHDDELLGVLSDDRTPGLKVHCVACFEAGTRRPLGIAHVFIYANPASARGADGAGADGADGAGADGGARPLHERQSARWVDAVASSLADAVYTAARVTFLADAEADQYPMLAGAFLAEHRVGGRGDGPEVRWCVRMRYDRTVRDEALGYWDVAQPKVSTYLEARAPAHRIRVELPASGSRHRREVDLRIRSAPVRLRRPHGPAATRRYRHVELPGAAEVYVTRAEQLDARGRAHAPMTSRERERYHRDEANRGHGAPIHWVLATSFSVATAAEQRGVLDLYASRWLIELLFRMLKSDGLDMERDASRRVGRWACVLLLGMDEALTAERLVAMREADDRPGAEEFTPDERAVLEADDHARRHPRSGRVYKTANRKTPGTVSWYAVQVAVLAGYLDHHNGPPGRKLMARGLQRLADRVEALRNQRLFEQRNRSVT